MAEMILGIGRQRNANEVIETADKELRKTEGVPRKIIARAGSVEIHAEKTDFDADFASYTIRVHGDGARVEAFRKAAAELGPVAATSEKEGWFICTVSPGGKGDTEQVLTALTALAEALPLPEVWRVQGTNYRIDRISPELLFQAMTQYKASDTHLAPGRPPIFRVDNETRTSELVGVLSAQQIYTLIQDIAPEQYWKEFETKKQTSFNYHQVGLGYARVSAFIKAGVPHCTLRFLPETIPSFEDLNVPKDSMMLLADLHHGLVLVTGMTGSGKSTTTAALVDWINTHKSLHILTIENPVEYVHMNKKSMISQRSTGSDVDSFNDAVTGALRHDPDVIVIGEMRDPDTIRSAINAAATGHLVISTLHSNTAAEVVNRTVSFFDPVERDLVRLQLRDCVRCIICQRLVPRIGGGRVPALEMAFNDTKAINDSIMKGDTDGIRIGMQQSASRSFIFEKYLFDLYKKNTITLDNARKLATEASVLDQMLMGTYTIPRLDSIKGGGH